MAEFTIADETLGSLRGKVIIVTGGSSGIGLATVELLLGLGAAVISGDLRPPPAPQVIYPSAGSAVPAFFTHVPTDVSVWADLVALFKRAVKIHGRVDHVFCNPGVIPDDYGFPLPPPDGLGVSNDLKEPNHAGLDVNLKGAMNTAALSIYHMQAQDPPGGSVVINSSITGLPKCSSRSADDVVFQNGIFAFGRYIKNSLDVAGLSSTIRVNVLIPEQTEGQANKAIQSVSVSARGAAHLMANTARHGYILHAGDEKYWEMEESNSSYGENGVPERLAG